MRLFLALELPKSVKEEIAKIQSRLRSAGLKAAWAKPEQSHLTLIFWEDFPEEKIDFLTLTLKKILSNSSPFPLGLGKLDTFPRPTRPRVLILKIEDPGGKLPSLVNALKKDLAKNRLFQEERPYVGHLTLGRIRKYRKAPINLPKVDIHLSFSAQRIALIKSQLTASGPIHTDLQVFPLRP